MRLILFDIDGTLINSSRIGRVALGRAMRATFGTAGGLETFEFAGKTDRRIVRELLVAEGWPAEAIAAHHLELDEQMTAAARELFTARTIWPCPGVLPLLDALERRDGVMLALLTGNIRHTVPLKLAAAGIDPARFVAGAYGSDSLERDELFAIALERTRAATGLPIEGRDVIIIGDTPADIRCARNGGGRAIAVATGPYPADLLLRHRPDHLFADLADTERVLQAILDPAPEPA
jgi:phosphoglycolate phosphatase-like HAD superfamily hydrolase